MTETEFLQHLIQNFDAIPSTYFDAQTGEVKVRFNRNVDETSAAAWIAAHIEGSQRIGALNAFFDETGAGFTRWGCIDIDGPGHVNGLSENEALDLACKTLAGLQAAGASPWLEVSHGGGFHLWVLTDRFVPAGVMSAFLRAFVPAKVEVFPKANVAGGKGFGNFVWAPFWGASDFCKMSVDGAVMSGASLTAWAASHDPGAASAAAASSSGRSFGASDFLERPLPPLWVIEEALGFISADPYHDWIKILSVIFKEYGPEGYELARDWSATSPKFSEHVFEDKWASFDGVEIRASVGSIVFMATRGGWDRRGWNAWTSTSTPAELGDSSGSGEGGGMLPETESDVSIALHAILVLTDFGNREVLGSEGFLWAYNESKGVWERIDSQDLHRQIVGYNGTWTMPVYDAKGALKRKKILLSATKTRGIRELIMLQLGAEDTWPSSAVPGVAFRNGFLGAQGLVGHSPEHFARMFVDGDYIEGSHLQAAQWNDFLARCFADRDPDLARAEIAALQEFAGAALMGMAPQFAKVFLLYGPGATGKSTFISVLRAMFGERELGMVKPQDLTDETKRVGLLGVRLNALEEMPGWKFGDAADFKEIVEGSKFVARYRYGHPFEARSQAAFLFSTNSLPDSNDTSTGFWRRWRIIEFSNVIPPEERRRDLGGQLAARARREPWLFSWAFEGYTRLMSQNRYTEAAGSNETIEEWQDLVDPVRAFVRDTLAPVWTEDDFVLSGVLYSEFRRWAAHAGVRPQALTGPRGFSIRLKQLGFVPHKQNGLMGFRVRLLEKPKAGHGGR